MIKKPALLSLLFIMSWCFIPTIDLHAENDPISLNEILQELEIAMDDVDNFFVEKDFLREGVEHTFRSILAKDGEDIIKIEVTQNIDSKYARKYAQEKNGIIHAQYKRIPSAYPGMISNTIEVPEQLRPKSAEIDIEGKKQSALLLYSTPRFTYGASVEELIKYRSALIFNYCPNLKTLIRFEYFMPKDDFNEKEVLNALSTFSCKIGESSLSDPIDNLLPHLLECKDCNLIIIGWEPLGANHVGAYGYEKNTTPHLDQFAKNAFLFENAISPSSWTLPVFMSWFTSLYPSQHKLNNKFSTYTEDEQIFSNLSELSPSVVTLAQVLKENNYKTAGFTGGAGVGRDFGFDSGFDKYYDKKVFGGFKDVFPKALKWIKRNRKSKFFVFVMGYDVHGRYPLPDEPDDQFNDKDYSGPYQGTVEEYWKLRNDSIDKEILDLTEGDIKFWRNWYDTKIVESDKKFGDFIQKLKKIVDMNNTVIVISSGSGNEFYEHKTFDHGFNLYDEVIRVPFVLKVGRKGTGRIKNQVRTIDMMPTVLDILNVNNSGTVNEQMQGISLVPVMKGEDLQLSAFSETDYLLQSFKRSIRTPDGWKFIYSMDTEERELYDLNQDPGELSNLLEMEGQHAYELEIQLFDWLKELGQDEKVHHKIIENVFQAQ